MQDTRRFELSTVSRRLSVVAGLYRTCVIGGVLEPSPTAYVQRSAVPLESPTLGLTHLQFEAMLTAARQSSNLFDLALVRCSGCSGCGSSRPSALTSRTWATNTATGSGACTARATRSCWSRCHRRSTERWTGQPATGRTGRCY